jgi:hypothetical protein
MTWVLLTGLLVASAAAAGEADVLDVKVFRQGGGTFRFVATVRHDDEGWKHYADRWEVLAPDGTVLATRVLRHPHVDEQPFTRALPGVRIPENVEWVTVRARDSEHGLGGAEVAVEIPR